MASVFFWVQRIGLSSSENSRNPISDKNLILSTTLEGMTRFEWQRERSRMMPVHQTYGGTCVSLGMNANDDNDDDDDDHVFGNWTSLRMMDDTLIVRIYAAHVPATFLFSRPF